MFYPEIKASNTLQIEEGDDLIVALNDLKAGTVISEYGASVTLQEDIPAKHKFARREIVQGERVSMYGLTVGEALVSIAAGQRISIQNLKHKAETASLPEEFSPVWNAPDVTKWENQTFMGYHRSDGKVGVANYWLVIPLVFCENRNIEVIREALTERLGYSIKNRFSHSIDQWVKSYQSGEQPAPITEAPPTSAVEKPFPHVDGIRFLTHEGGCGGPREDALMLAKLLAGYITHPNVAGATVLSLGCQNLQISLLREQIEARSDQFDKPLFILEQQQSRSESAFLGTVIQQTLEGLAVANKNRRKPAPLSKLLVGLECGGSDGFSGISANPVLGRVSDMLAALGGGSILAEFPELSGVEQNLLQRMPDCATAEKFLQLMRDYEQAAKAVGSGFDANPSPGNIKDGLITDAMKSAGAAQKGGTSPVVDVLDYPELAQKSGLHLLCTPGNDVESTTALAASGAQLILFTTGLGTPTGNPVAPVIKVSSNTSLATRMADLIDFDAGTVIQGNESLEAAADALFEQVVTTASGDYVPKAVRLEQHDFIPWKRGVSL
ncbi:MAG: altronate dehydratase family protein [Bacteroidota bacterium]